MRTEKKLSMKNIPSIAFSYPPLKKGYYSLKKSDNFDLYYLVSVYKIFFWSSNVKTRAITFETK